MKSLSQRAGDWGGSDSDDTADISDAGGRRCRQDYSWWQERGGIWDILEAWLNDTVVADRC